MPYIQVYHAPTIFLTRKKVKIYHAYDHRANPLTYWYTTDLQEREEFEFDVRDLPGYSLTPGSSIEFKKKIIKNAVDDKLLKIPKKADT